MIIETKIAEGTFGEIHNKLSEINETELKGVHIKRIIGTNKYQLYIEEEKEE